LSCQGSSQRGSCQGGGSRWCWLSDGEDSPHHHAVMLVIDMGRTEVVEAICAGSGPHCHAMVVVVSLYVEWKWWQGRCSRCVEVIMMIIGEGHAQVVAIGTG